MIEKMREENIVELVQTELAAQLSLHSSRMALYAFALITDDLRQGGRKIRTNCHVERI